MQGLDGKCGVAELRTSPKDQALWLVVAHMQ